MDPDILAAFEALPKHRYWLRASRFKHREATPERIIATLSDPTLPVEYQEEGRTAYYRFLENDGFWFRVVLHRNGSLYTAFEDDDTMRKIGRP